MNFMHKRTAIIALVIVLALLAAGYLWYAKQAVFPEQPTATSPQPIEKQGENTTSNTDTQPQVSWQHLAMEWPADMLDVSRWEKRAFKAAGVELLLPKTWRVNENFVIYPEAGDESWIIVYEDAWPKYFKDKIGKGKEFSVAEAIMSKHLVYDDGYNFTLQGNRFNEITLPIGTGVEYPRLLETFYEFPNIKDKTRERRLFILFSEKTKKTYAFEYEWDFYNPVIDRAFEEMVKTARVLE